MGVVTAVNILDAHEEQANLNKWLDWVRDRQNELERTATVEKATDNNKLGIGIG